MVGFMKKKCAFYTHEKKITYFHFSNWDGGDCCGNMVNKTQCRTCECLDPFYNKPKKLFEWSRTASRNCPHDFCIAVKFFCIENQTAVANLNADLTEMAQGTFKGYFEGYEDHMVAISSNDHPITDKSTFELSFSIPELCPTNVFFVAYSDGIGVEYRNKPTDFILMTDSLNPHLTIPTVPKDARNTGVAFRVTDEFKVTLRIFYDDDFHAKFGGSAMDK